MKIVFVSDDWLEAQAIAAMLEGSGIKSAVWGADGVRSGVSETPETADVRVAVSDEEFPDALALVDDYRKAKPAT